MKVTYLGTTVLLFEDEHHKILFDANFSRPSIFQLLTKSLNTNQDLVDKIIQQYHLDSLDALFISHTHYDHVLDAPYIALKTNTHLYGSKSLINLCIGANINQSQLHQYNNQVIHIGDFHIKVIPSIHSKPHFFNNDLGQEIELPVHFPLKMKDYKEGGSYDFYIEHHDKKYLIRPSFNYIENQFNHIHVDYLFLGLGSSNENKYFLDKFIQETIVKVEPSLIIPIHHDNFFLPMDHYQVMFSSKKGMKYISKYAYSHHIDFKELKIYDTIEL